MRGERYYLMGIPTYYYVSRDMQFQSYILYS